jgi:hypothetical protein
MLHWCISSDRRFHDVVTHCGLGVPTACPVAFGKNEKGGMSEDEFDKYMTSSVLPLFPNDSDIIVKRVLLKMNMGPGRNNDDLLFKLKLHGFYLLPSVPNAMHLMQEMDAWLGEFKRGFYNNLDLVIISHLTNKAIPTVESLVGLLVFGVHSLILSRILTSLAGHA